MEEFTSDERSGLTLELIYGKSPTKYMRVILVK